MKNILGLDLGTTSIGWAVVKEAENESEKSSITRLGVRVIPLSTDEQNNFEKGKEIDTNKNRTLKRSMRRNLQRYKQRRAHLIAILKENHIIDNDTILNEQASDGIFHTYQLRSDAASKEISLEDFAKVLLMINKKRGYKTSRKSKDESDGQSIDGMEAARRLYEDNITPAQLNLTLHDEGKRLISDFYPSDLINEFNRVWETQQKHYSEILTDELKDQLTNKDSRATWAIIQDAFKKHGVEIIGIKRGKRNEVIIENLKWRVNGLSERLDPEQLIIVFQEINKLISSSSGYLGKISDRSKELIFNRQTIGQSLYQKLMNDKKFTVKNTVYYRQDYLDEFEKIWEVQRLYHPELTDKLKAEIRDVAIFYQRRLRSQKGLIAFCELESKNIIIAGPNHLAKSVQTGSKVCPKSSPLFQEFRIWQKINDIVITPLDKRYSSKKVRQDANNTLFPHLIAGPRNLTKEEKDIIANELRYSEKLSDKDILMLLFGKSEAKQYTINFKELDGNRTIAKIYNTLKNTYEEEESTNLKGNSNSEVYATLTSKLIEKGLKNETLSYDPLQVDYSKGEISLMTLWHLLYSFEGDSSKEGDQHLVQKLIDNYGFEPIYAKALSKVTFEQDYASLSSKAIRKILPYMKEGQQYSDACQSAGYNHSKSSITKEENLSRHLKQYLEQLPKNSLRNPVVEKILNQMVNVINALVQEYGTPDEKGEKHFDEIRIEMARELKRSAKEREAMTSSIAESNRMNETIKKKLTEPPFNLSYVSRTDVIRYKLYKELEKNKYHTLYSNTYIPQERLFSHDFDIEHIIPQASFYDDTFSNKTLEKREINIEKGNQTALDYVKNKFNIEEYRQRVEDLYEQGAISKDKKRKLLTGEGGETIPDGFLERDLRNTQYIAKKALSMLREICYQVTPTVGSITDKLREDWDLTDIMRELNWNKYSMLGMTSIIEGREGQRVYRINDWTKRNDHRHHAMDALTVAFTKPALVQYFNHQASSNDELIGIRKKYFEGKKVASPIPNEFRAEAIKFMKEIIVSNKAKNKVATPNKNMIQTKSGKHQQETLTPRGQLHKETVFGKIKQYVTEVETVGSGFNEAKIKTVCNKAYRTALLERLYANNNDPKKAFTGKNSLDKNPLYVDKAHTIMVPKKVKTVHLEDFYTVRKPISKDLPIEKVVDVGLRKLLKDRIDEYGDATKAFNDLDNNPAIYHGKAVKRATIKQSYSDAVALHVKRDVTGRIITDKEGKKIPCDYVQTGNNHHVAIFEDAEGNYQEHIVSFFEVMERKRQGLPIIDKEYNKELGWKFLFTLKQNEYFVLPGKEYINEETGEIFPTFNPSEYDLLDPQNYSLISPHLFRVQKMSSKDYWFRHHLETQVQNDNLKLKGITWERITALNKLKGIIKVRVNHIGQIVAIGEYK